MAAGAVEGIWFLDANSELGVRGTDMAYRFLIAWKLRATY